MPTIREATRSAQWRDDLLPANFDGFPFHVETYARESGRRIALHEFPKKELPYAEDMGHTAVAFSVRGYIIVYPHDGPGRGGLTLYQTDYRIARDALQDRLDRGGPGVLQLPTFIKYPMIVVCKSYRLSEEQRAGGYCVFDMQFVERGKKPFYERVDPLADLYQKTFELRRQVSSVWAAEVAKTGKTVMGTFNPLVRFIGPPRKHGPIKPKTTPSESEFTRRT